MKKFIFYRPSSFVFRPSLYLNMHKLYKDENGQVMLFTALVVLVLVSAIAVVVNIGQTIIWRIRMQNAVDSAALACGTYQARALNKLQRLNDEHWVARSGEAGVIWALMGSDWVWPVWTPWSVYGQVRSINSTTTTAVNGILALQEVINSMYPLQGVNSAINIGADNGADRIVPVRPLPNPCSLDVRKYNRSGNHFFYEMPAMYFLWMVSWNDDGFYGGSPQPATFFAYKNEQDRRNTFLLLPGWMRDRSGNELVISGINTAATVWTRREPRQRGNTQLSDESQGNPWILWSRDFNTSLSPVIMPGGASGRSMGILH